jgi:uncharacterized protein
LSEPASGAAAARVEIHYRRPPDRLEIYSQRLVQRTDRVLVTLLERLETGAAIRIDGRTVLEPGSPIVWFTFPGMHHDVGRFHTADGRFTGIYANILTPVRFLAPCVWETTDLFLDVWLESARRPRLLDEDELQAAIEAGHLPPAVAARARAEAEHVMEQARSGAWPPAIVDEWTLERALAACGPAR